MKFASLILTLTLSFSSFGFNMTRASEHIADSAAVAATLDLPVDTLDWLTASASPQNLATRLLGNTFGYSCRKLCKDHFDTPGACGAACGSVKYSLKKLAEGKFTKATPILGAINNGLYGATETTNGPVDESLKIVMIESIEDLVGAAIGAGTIFIGWKNTEDTLKGSAWTGAKVAASLWFVCNNLAVLVSQGLQHSANKAYTWVMSSANHTESEGDL